MKIITDSKQQDTIHVDELTNHHIIVCVNDNNPYILTRDDYRTGKYRFSQLRDEVTNGNGMSGRFDTIKEAVMLRLDAIAAFHQSDWKQALQWLIDNA
jgi:hypothetical protein